MKNFCYLGDRSDGGGGSDLATTTRVGWGWKAFNILSSILCGKRYTSNLITYDSETWMVGAIEEKILRRAERRMV